MKSHRGTCRVGKLAKLLGVSRGGFYGWLARVESGRSRADRELLTQIRGIQESRRYRYGSPRVTQELQRSGRRVGHNRVARLMHQNGLGARPRRQFRVTTKAASNQVAAANLLERRFWPRGANQVWVSDITYVATAEGWLYLAVVMDLYSRRVVGWSMGSRLGTQLVLQALWMAVLNRRAAPGLIFHSDRGSQYSSAAFRKALGSRGYRQSMSRKGNVWDNAPCEALFKSLKTELMGGKALASRAQGRREIFEYLEVFYNRVRLHSSLGYRAPAEYEVLGEAASA